MEEFDKFVKRNTTWLDNEYVSTSIILFLVVYASLVAPKLPNDIIKLFDYTIVKLLFFFSIVFISRKNASIALVASLALLMSVMVLNKVKFEEMVSIGNSNICTCGCILNDIIPTTPDGQLLISEAKNAVANNVLPISKAEELAKNVVMAESKGEQILIPKTEDGLKRLDEINQSLADGKITEAGAKKMLSVIIVAESIMSAKSTNSVNSVNSEISSESASTSVGSTGSVESSAGSATMAEMAEEVLRRKDEEVNKRGGVPLSGEELKKICASVLEDFKKSNILECNDSVSKSLTSSVESNDPMMSTYAPIK